MAPATVVNAETYSFTSILELPVGILGWSLSDLMFEDGAQHLGEKLWYANSRSPVHQNVRVFMLQNRTLIRSESYVFSD